jgi:hypothetical protein
MGFGEILLLRAFGRPRGILGRLGGRIMARMNAPCAASVLALLHVEPKHRVLEIGFGSRADGGGGCRCRPVARNGGTSERSK